MWHCLLGIDNPIFIIDIFVISFKSRDHVLYNVMQCHANDMINVVQQLFKLVNY